MYIPHNNKQSHNFQKRHNVYNTPNNKALLTGSWMVLHGTLLWIKNHIKTLLNYTYSVKSKHQSNIQEQENPKKYKEKAHWDHKIKSPTWTNNARAIKKI